MPACNVPERQCTAIARGTGERCTAWKANGYEVCSGHAGLGKLDAKLANRRSVEARRDRAERRKMGILDVAATRLERHGDEIVRIFLEAARNGDWRAADALWTRVHGKPTERVELSEGDPLDVAKMTAAELASLRGAILQAHPELRAIDGGQAG